MEETRSVDLRLPHVLKIKEQGNSAWYAIEPLEPGYGITIAHALKRVAQSSLEGIAVTALRMNNPSASTSLPGVEETLTDIILNVKQIRVRSLTRQSLSTFISLNVRSKRIVRAADLVVPDGIEILNPELYLATIQNEDAHLDIEMMIKTGRGYVSADTRADQPLGFIPVDAIHTPVRKVEYSIEHARIGNVVNFDKILFFLETDGTLAPDEALNQSVKLLVQQLLPLTSISNAVDSVVYSSSQVLIPQNIYNLSINVLNLPVRSHNALKRNHIVKVGQILMMDGEALLAIRNFGEKSMQPLIDALQNNGCFTPLLANPSDVVEP